MIMGLDMYLEKVKRIKNAKLDELVKLNDYFSWVTRPNKYKDSTFMEWNRTEMEDVNLDLAEDYISEYKHRYSTWDKDKKYGFHTMFQQVAYWRKANHIHNWFVENVQNGTDDCGCYEVTKEQLEQLLEICIVVRDNSKMIHDSEGETYIKDTSTAERLLPTQSGFFFGSTDYDKWYLEDIRYTIKELRKILKTTDFEHEIVFYTSSW
jgi:hypothetical protein